MTNVIENIDYSCKKKAKLYKTQHKLFSALHLGISGIGVTSLLLSPNFPILLPISIGIFSSQEILKLQKRASNCKTSANQLIHIRIMIAKYKSTDFILEDTDNRLLMEIVSQSYESVINKSDTLIFPKSHDFGTIKKKKNKIKRVS